MARRRNYHYLGDEGGDAKCSCGGRYYQGGWCFKCGKYHASKHNKHSDEADMVDYFSRCYGWRLTYGENC